MNNPHQRPVSQPKRFIGSVFDLAYGAHDGSEPLSAAEIKACLQEAGIDCDAAWKAASALLTTSANRLSLADVHRQRLAGAKPAVPAQAVRSRSVLLDEINQLLSLLGPRTGAVFGRKWEESTAEDLAALCDQLKRQIERSKEDERTEQ